MLWIHQPDEVADLWAPLSPFLCRTILICYNESRKTRPQTLTI